MSLRSEDSGGPCLGLHSAGGLGPFAFPPKPTDTRTPTSGAPRGLSVRKETREGRRPEAHAHGQLPATQGLRRGGGARGGERRLLTGGACALGALIVPRSCRAARQPPARRVSQRRVPWWVRSLSLFPRPPLPPRSPHPYPAPSTPSRLRHPPAPHTQDENALPGTTQQRLDGFGHGPAVAYPQHHLQPLRLGESLPAAAPLASVTAAPLCLSGSRRTPLRTRRAASQALALCCREPPTPSSYR